ncbi:MAG TPA: NAD(+)--arginine ADP-ribosyltransferase [Mycobacterium sp.]|nr:NAD(+)--arginine ADP-ribosyltransferase [Mycobacterium sp.]
MAPLAVDPATLDRAGGDVVSAAENLGSAICALTTALSGCAGMAGDDPAGAALGRSYDRSAAKLIEAMVATRNGLCSIGDGVRMSAHNYSVAEAMSDVGRRSDPLAVPPWTGPLSAGSPPSVVGTGDNAPPGWGWVAPYIGIIWPTGDSAKLRAAAAAWSGAGTKFALAEIEWTAGPMGAIRAQLIPEGAAIDAAFSDALSGTTSIVAQCQTIAAHLSSYAVKVDEVHAAILDLLARICDPLTGIKEVWDFLTGEDEDEIKRIADDIRTVVSNFTAEVNALRSQIAAVLTEATTALDTMADHTAKQWDQFLHGAVVGQVANQVGQRFKGIGEEGWGLVKGLWEVSQVRAVVDPIGYLNSLAEVDKGIAPLVGAGGPHAPSIGQSWEELGKSIIHWDDWNKNPGEALGKTEFDLGMLALPGGPLSKLGRWGRLGRDGITEKPPLSDLLSPPDTGPPAPPISSPPKEPVPRGQPPKSGRPAPAPADTPPPYSPTESKTPVADKSGGGSAPKPQGAAPGLDGQHSGPAPNAPSEHLPPAHPHAPALAEARVPASPGGDPAEPVPGAAHRPHSALSAPPPTEPHAPTRSMPEAGHPPERAPHSGEPGGYGHHEVPPDSTVEYPGAERRTTISGHGAYYPDDGHMTVPRGTTITVYAEHGSSITDELGNLIETGGDTSHVYSRTFHPGEQIPNYTIYPPDGLNIMGAPQTVTNPTRLTELIDEEMGTVHLAICPFDETSPTGIIYDVDGTFDQSTGVFTPYIRRRGF